MNTKSILFLSCFTAMVLAASAAMAAPRGGGHFASMPARGGGRAFIHNSMGQWNGGHWNGGGWGGNWHHGHYGHNGHNDVVFIGGFGYPFWGWDWGYPYGYYGYYPYGYYPGGYYPYGYNGYGYNGYGYNGYGYGQGGYGYNNGYGYSNQSRVAEMQRQLAHAGYYHGAIDGIMGPQTRRALRASRLDHGTGAYAE